MAEQEKVAPPEAHEGVEKDRQLIVDARARGKGSLFGTFVKLSGPGWLQSAITLGGGSLAGSLYIGVLGGMAFLWLQPFAMILGIIMLSAISFVTLSTGQRPFQALATHVNPVMAWGWALAAMMANLVWAIPQFGLGTAAITSNLIPGLGETMAGGNQAPKVAIILILLAVSTGIVMIYDSGAKGVKLFEFVLKCMVAVVVISFFGVVIKMSTSGALDWGALITGFIPNPKLFVSPPDTVMADIMTLDPGLQEFWKTRFMEQQRDVMISAAAVAVGINMTFLLPYSMLKRGWDKDFRGLAIFDLSTGLFIPFMLAVSCVVIASGTQFHRSPTANIDASDVTARAQFEYERSAEGASVAFADLDEARRTELNEQARANMTDAERSIAGMLSKPGALSLAGALEPLTGPLIAQKVFGIGVLGMALSTIIILMLINGFCVCEMIGIPNRGWPYRIACILPGISGSLVTYLWGNAALFWLAVPTSVFGMTLLPIAYIAFFSMFNNKSLMGDNMPKGGKRITWNILMGIATLIATAASVWAIWAAVQTRDWGKYILIAMISYVVLVVVAQIFHKKPTSSS